MLKIGLTGGIGSGKSSTTEYFKELGVTVIDADTIAHQHTTANSEALAEISNQLGQQFISNQGELDRKKLAQHVFNHPEKKLILEKILHPRVKQGIMDKLDQLESSPYVILAIPLLLETDFAELVDRILVIDAPEDIRIQRVQERDGRSAENVISIINQQIDRKTRLEKADDVLDNSGTLAELHSSIKQLHEQYLQISSHDKA